MTTRPRHLIFDLGNVLIRFRPDEDLDDLYPTDDARFLLEHLIRTPEWLRLDEGTLDPAGATAVFCARHPGRAELIRRALDARHRLLTPIPGNVALLPPLKEAGYGLYYLSNYHADLFAIAEQEMDFLALFDGGVVSAHVRAIKPAPAIYQALLARYDLVAGDCLFIDDAPANVAGAEAVGIPALCLESPGRLAAELRARALLPAEGEHR